MFFFVSKNFQAVQLSQSEVIKNFICNRKTQLSRDPLVKNRPRGTLVLGYTPTTWPSFKIRRLREGAQKVERNILLSFKANFHQLKHTRAGCRCQNQNPLEKLLHLEGKFLLIRCVVQKLWRKTCLLHYATYWLVEHFLAVESDIVEVALVRDSVKQD